MAMAMAPSHKHALLALLVACFAAAVSLPQPSAAIRIIPGIIPCLPGVPRIPFVPCYEAPPLPPLKEPAECWTPLEKLAPCAGFLTNSSVTSALGACCDGYQFVLDHAAICFCHYSNGDIAKIIPGPLNSTRMFGLSGACGSVINLETLITYCDMKEVPPMTPPSPPPSYSPVAKAPLPAPYATSKERRQRPEV